MKSIVRLLAAALAMVGLLGCNPVTNEDVGVPQTVIPSSILKKFVKYMDFYKGDNPPVIEGEYVSSPHKLVYDSHSGKDESDNIQFGDYCFAFNRDSDSTLTFCAIESEQTINGRELTVMGHDDYFTMYFIGEGSTNGISFRKSYLISGRRTDEGIADFYYAFIMLDKGSDPYDELMDINDYRVIKDGNDLAGNWFWQDKKTNSGGLSDDMQLKAE